MARLTLSSLRRSLAQLTVISLGGLAAISTSSGCSSGDAAPSSPSLGSTAAPITAADVISRAELWVSAKLLYCQSANHQADGDSACPSTCTRTDNADWDPYRSDCSGLISWAWGLPAPGRVTGEFAPYDTTVSTKIAAADLAPGDALNSTPDEHIILFKSWTTVGSEAVFIEEPGCSSNPNYAHEFTSAVTIDTGADTIKVSYDGMTYYPIRFNSISQQSPDYAASYVSQSWPLSSDAPIQLVAGVMQTGSIDLKNTGGKTWPAGVVKLAPIPRDQASNMASSTWLSPTRVSTLAADVAPGAVGHFEWDLEASTAGDFQPYFSLVADGITWFADSGGPPDNDIQVNIHVTAAPASTGTGGAAGSDGAGGSPAQGGESGGGEGGAPAKGGAGGTPGHAGATGTAGMTSGAGAAPGTAGSPATAGGATQGAAGQATGTTGGTSAMQPGSAAGTGGSGATIVSVDDGSSENSGGCDVGGGVGARAHWSVGWLAGLSLLVSSRRRRHVSKVS